MEMRPLGASGLHVSVLGFGCGAVGGLMVRGEARDQERAVAYAIELGVTYFDTAPGYGDGASESNLGRALGLARPEVVVGTKFHAAAGAAAGIAASLEASLRRLGRERVDLLQLHNPVSASGAAGTIRPDVVISEVLPALQALREQGKFRVAGFTAVGETAALHRVLAASGWGAAQIPFNLLNPSASRVVPASMPAQDYAGTLEAAHAAGIGAIAIRTLAGGALSASEARHPLGAAMVEPIGSGPDYATDARRAWVYERIAREAGCASVVELAIRFVISHAGVSTAMVGLSSLDQLRTAAAAVGRGALAADTLDAIRAAQDHTR